MRRYIWLLILVLLIAKVACVVARGPSPIVMDAEGYWKLGQMAAGGDWLLKEAPIAYRTPMYPWLIAATRLGFDRSLFPLVLIQSVLWLATIGLTALMSVWWTGDRRNGWLTAALAVPLVSSVTYVSAVLTETLFVFLVVAHLAATMRLGRRPSVGAGLVVGITLGGAILTRPIAMLLWVPGAFYLILLWYFLPYERGAPCRKRGWMSVLLSGLVCVAMITPWMLRNQSMFGKPFLTEFVGRNVWIVAFQEGSGTGLDLPQSESADALRNSVGDQWEILHQSGAWRDTWTVSNALTTSGVDDASADQMMKATALDALNANRQAATYKAVRRCINFWRTCATVLPDQVADLEVPPDPSQTLFAGEAIWGVKVAPIDIALRFRASNSLFANTLVMIAVVVGTILLIGWRKTRAGALWFGLVMIYFGTVTGLLEIPAYRYRMVVEPLMLLVLVSAFSPFLFRTAPDVQTHE
ncbi:MAG: hypothetical protein AAFU85_06265 [Planctomycetota bacterium]